MTRHEELISLGLLHASANHDDHKDAIDALSDNEYDALKTALSAVKDNLPAHRKAEPAVMV